MFWAISLGEPIGRDLAVVGFIRTTICMMKDKHSMCDRHISMNMTLYTLSEALSSPFVGIFHFFVKSFLLFFVAMWLGWFLDSWQGFARGGDQGV